MLMISNFLAKRGVKSILAGLLVSSFSMSGLASVVDKESSISSEAVFPVKSRLVIDKVQLEKTNAKVEKMFYSFFKQQKMTNQQDDFVVIKVETRHPVNLLGAMTPTIYVDGKPVATSFMPYTNSTFYGLVNRKDFKSAESVALKWSDLATDSDKQSNIVYLNQL